MPPSLQDNHFTSPIYSSYPPNQNTPYDASNTGWYNSATANDAPNAQSSTKSKATPQDTEKLRRLPELRPIPWRKGKECAPEKSTHSSRPQTRGAFLLVTRGSVRQPCTHCETGAGRFSVCVSLNDWYHGACATCVMATRGNKCSLRQDVEEGLLPPDGAQQESTRLVSADEDDDDDEDQQNSSLKRKRSPTRAYVSGYSPVEQVVGEQQTPLQNMGSTNTYPSYNPSGANHPAHPYLPQAGAYTASTNAQPPSQDLVQPEKSSLLDYVYQKQYPSNGKKRHQLLQQAESESSQSTNGPLNKRVRLGERGEASSSMSPRIQQRLPVGNYISTGNGGAAYPEPETMPLIDMLPKKKQREIFGILGGLQSGIRLVRQQTNSLQKQLDVLQTALGIDLGDDDDDGN